MIVISNNDNDLISTSDRSNLTWRRKFQVLHLFSQVVVSQDDGDEEDVKKESEEKADQDHKVHIGVVLLHIIHPG